VRDNTSDSATLRWEVLKSMLDNFPQLLDRTERYILDKRSAVHTGSADHLSPDAKELMQKAVSEYHKERLRK
jgi:transcriptional regulator GlxA family with amidase domain